MASLTTLGDIRLAQSRLSGRRACRVAAWRELGAENPLLTAATTVIVLPLRLALGGAWWRWWRADLRWRLPFYFSRAVARILGACAADGNRRDGADHPLRPDHASGLARVLPMSAKRMC